MRALLKEPIEGVEGRSGMSRTGMPLSLNRAPSADLDPWIARIVVARVETDPDFETSCGLCNDIAFLRILIGGQWQAETRDGPLRFGAEPVLVGPHSKLLPVRCTGPLSTVGIGFRPGALRCLLGRDMPELVDRIEYGDPFGLLGQDAATHFAQDLSVEEWASVIEDGIRAFIMRTNPKLPDPLSAAFEHASFADPNIAPGDFAAMRGVSRRTLERTVRRDYGLTPRTVLRRARALDLAAQLLGVADDEEESEFLARYFDQSHRIKEFQRFFGTTPEAFRSERRVLLTINLETRAARRLEELERIEPGDPRPWHAGENI